MKHLGFVSVILKSKSPFFGQARRLNNAFKQNVISIFMSDLKKLQIVLHDSLSLPPEKIFTVPTCMSCRSIVLSTRLSGKLIPASCFLTLSAPLS